MANLRTEKKYIDQDKEMNLIGQPAIHVHAPIY